MVTPRAPMLKLEPTGKTSCVATPSEMIALDYHHLNPTNRLLLPRPRMLLEGPLDVEALHKTVEELVARHTGLGSRFVEEGSVTMHHLAGERLRIPFDVVSFEDTPVDQHEARWDQFFEVFARPFDLAAGPMVRAALIKLGPERHVLTFVIHHAVFDRASMEPLIAEIKAGYRSMTTNSAWPPPALQCIDLAAYTETFCASPAGLRQRAFWDKTLAGVKALELPTDRPRDSIDAERDAHPRGMALRSVAEVMGFVQPPLHAEMTKLARAEKTSSFVVLLGALATVLYRARAQDDITLQTPLSLRNKPALANMIGYVGNSLLLRLDMTGNPTVRQLLGRIRNTVLMSWANAEVPLMDRVPHNIRRMNVNYVPGVEGAGGTAEEFAPGVTITPVRQPPELAHIQIPWDVQLWLYDAADRCRVRFMYMPELFDKATVQGVLDSMLAVVDEMCRNPDKTLTT